MKLIEVLSSYKINHVHLHMTDDEGWRLEIPDLPELTQVDVEQRRPGPVYSYKLRYIVGFGLVEMAISTNPTKLVRKYDYAYPQGYIRHPVEVEQPWSVY